MPDLALSNPGTDRKLIQRITLDGLVAGQGNVNNILLENNELYLLDNIVSITKEYYLYCNLVYRHSNELSCSYLNKNVDNLNCDISFIYYNTITTNRVISSGYQTVNCFVSFLQIDKSLICGMQVINLYLLSSKLKTSDSILSLFYYKTGVDVQIPIKLITGLNYRIESSYFVSISEKLKCVLKTSTTNILISNVYCFEASYFNALFRTSEFNNINNQSFTSDKGEINFIINYSYSDKVDCKGKNIPAYYMESITKTAESNNINNIVSHLYRERLLNCRVSFNFRNFLTSKLQTGVFAKFNATIALTNYGELDCGFSAVKSQNFISSVVNSISRHINICYYVGTIELSKITVNTAPNYNYINCSQPVKYLDLLSANLSRETNRINSIIKGIFNDTLVCSFSNSKYTLIANYFDKHRYEIPCKLAFGYNLIAIGGVGLYNVSITSKFPPTKNFISASTYKTIYWVSINSSRARETARISCRMVEVNELNYFLAKTSNRGWGSISVKMFEAYNVLTLNAIINTQRRNNFISIKGKVIEVNGIRCGFPIRGGMFNASFYKIIEANYLHSNLARERHFLDAYNYGIEASTILASYITIRLTVKCSYLTQIVYRLNCSYDSSPTYNFGCSYTPRSQELINCSFASSRTYKIVATSTGIENGFIKCSYRYSYSSLISGGYTGIIGTDQIQTKYFINYITYLEAIIPNVASQNYLFITGFGIENNRLDCFIKCLTVQLDFSTFTCRVICYKQFDNTYPLSQVVEQTFNTFDIEEIDD